MPELQVRNHWSGAATVAVLTRSSETELGGGNGGVTVLVPPVLVQGRATATLRWPDAASPPGALVTLQAWYGTWPTVPQQQGSDPHAAQEGLRREPDIEVTGGQSGTEPLRWPPIRPSLNQTTTVPAAGSPFKLALGRAAIVQWVLMWVVLGLGAVALAVLVGYTVVHSIRARQALARGNAVLAAVAAEDSGRGRSRRVGGQDGAATGQSTLAWA